MTLHRSDGAVFSAPPARLLPGLGVASEPAPFYEQPYPKALRLVSANQLVKTSGKSVVGSKVLGDCIEAH